MPIGVRHSGARDCDHDGLGHDPHWIQVLRVAPGNTALALRDVRIIDTTTIQLDVDTSDRPPRESVARHNHDAGRVHRPWQRFGEGRLISGASLLQVGPPLGAVTFSVATGELGPCGGGGAA